MTTTTIEQSASVSAPAQPALSKATKEKIRKITGTTLRYILLCFVAVIMVGPFLWLLSTAMKSGSENIFAYPPQFLPEQPTFGNFVKVVETLPFFKYLGNSLMVAALSVTSNLILSSLAAYPLARMEFKGKSLIFFLILSTMMVPFQLLMIPVYDLALSLGLKNSYLGLILPHACTAFGVFLMRQAFLSVPKEMEESALIDGANRLQIWWRIMLPLIRPTMATLAIFSFMAVWGDFLWPLILLDDPELYTLPLGVNQLAGTFSMDWRLVAAGAVFAVVPILTLFAFTQRYFIEGAMKGAVKG